MQELDPGSLDAGFSSAKKRLLVSLKRKEDASLSDLAAELGISKMAALRHLTVLEAKGLVERSYRGGGRGRPRAIFRLAPTAANLFPEAYAHMTKSALGFIEEKLGRNAVVQLLEQRTREVYERYRGRFAGKDFRGRVAELARVRDEGGYMAEVGSARKGTVEIFEFNCPIRAVAEDYWEACNAEVRLFRRLLNADVEASHRVVAGDPICRFLIRRKGDDEPKAAR